MNYKEMKKEKLIELVKEGRHLKTAIEAKDKEINELKAKVSDASESLKDEMTTNKKLTELVKEGRHLKTAIEAKDKEINELKAKVSDVRKNLKDEYENEINSLKKKLRDSELSIEILADKKLADIRNSYEINEKQLRLDAKNAAEIAIKKAKELEEVLELLKSVQRAFQGSLDMSINLTSYFEDKVMRRGE